MHSTAKRSRLVTALALCLLAPAFAAAPSQAADTPTSPPTSAIARAGDATPTTGELAASLERAGAKVADTAPRGTSVAVAPRDPERGIGLGHDDLRIGIPHARTASDAEVVDGMTVYRNVDTETAVAVNPTAAGGQLLVNVGGADSPTAYRFPLDLPAGAALRLTDDGGAEVSLRDGTLVASIAAPWAQDASGAAVPTRFRVVGDTLVQDVAHRVAGTTYPVLADPSIFRCDYFTHTCVKFTKRETKKINRRAGLLGGTAAAIAGAVCAIIGGGWQGATLCAVTVAAVGGDLADTFAYAASKGRCVELHFLGAFGVLTRWKVERC